MEQYLQYMKTLRSQMNDVEDQATKISVEEQMHITTIHTMEKDLQSAKSEARELKEETDQMVKARGQICSKILENHRKIASLDADMSTLNQTLELIQQERVSLSAKISEKSAYYNTVASTMNAKLYDQQDWVNSHKFTVITGEHGLVKDKIEQQIGESIKSMAITVNQTGEAKNLMAKLDYSQAKLSEVIQMKSQLLEETTKMKQSLKQVKHRLSAYKQEVRALDMKTLEVEQEALLSDKAGESEYLQSLNIQIQKLKEVSHTIECACGEKYKVDLNLCA